jgi:hypothetical protein
MPSAQGTWTPRADCTTNCEPRRLGTKWESPALATALYGSVPLTCAWRDLRDRDGDLVAEIRMHGWGSGVAGSNPAVPTVFRTLVPLIGNESSHDRSHLAPAGRANPRTRRDRAGSRHHGAPGRRGVGSWHGPPRQRRAGPRSSHSGTRFGCGWICMRRTRSHGCARLSRSRAAASATRTPPRENWTPPAQPSPNSARRPTSPAWTPCGPAGPRADRSEVQVLRLVAVGKTNREIAATLVISEHTVARHVQKHPRQDRRAIAHRCERLRVRARHGGTWSRLTTPGITKMVDLGEAARVAAHIRSRTPTQERESRCT